MKFVLATAAAFVAISAAAQSNPYDLVRQYESPSPQPSTVFNPNDGTVYSPGSGQPPTHQQRWLINRR